MARNFFRKIIPFGGPEKIYVKGLSQFVKMACSVVDKVKLNPLWTVDGYSHSLRDATGPVDVYSRIPTSTQVTCLAT